MINFEEILRQPQAVLKQSLIKELCTMKYKPYVKNGFIYCKGEIPVMLVAHLDTVHNQLNTICYSQDGNIIMSPEGIGGDDRAGVYMILQIIKKYRCHVLFCEDEELGGVGAYQFVKANISPNINYMVELDRRGSNDAVFYECDNPKFTQFVTSFGFKENFGTFSDISVIAPELKVAAVNISAGYYNEHTLHEFIDMSVINNNIERVGRMINTATEKFEYYALNYYGRYDYDVDTEVKELMLLTGYGYVVNGNLELEEFANQYYIDNRNNVYTYFDNDDELMIKLDNYRAYNEYGMAIKFMPEYAEEYEVISDGLAEVW